MAEPEVLSDFADQKLQILQLQQSQHKLPKIEQSLSRANVKSKAEKRKTPPLLPLLKHSMQKQADVPQAAGDTEHFGETERDDFALEIEERLKMVLQNVNQGDDEQFGDCDQQVDFQELIKQNREKLKQHKLKNQSKPHTNNLIQNKEDRKTKSKTIKTINRTDNMYQKRMKQYRDASTQNKFIQKKKQIIAHKQEAAEKSSKLAKLKQEPNQFLKQNIHPINQHQSMPSKLPQKSKFPEKQIPKQLHIQNKTANLFDNIHNFLQNPHKGRAASEVKRSNKPDIKSLQEKIKQINSKLGVNQNLQTNSNLETQTFAQKTVLDWKRIECTRGNSLRCFYDSNFEKQVDRIGTLQQKNAAYLGKFLDHQKTLVELTLLKKVHPKSQITST